MTFENAKKAYELAVAKWKHQEQVTNEAAKKAVSMRGEADEAEDDMKDSMHQLEELRWEANDAQAKAHAAVLDLNKAITAVNTALVAILGAISEDVAGEDEEVT